MKEYIRDYLTVLILFVLSWFTFKKGLIALAVPLAVASVTVSVLMVYVLIHMIRKRGECRARSTIKDK